MLNAIDTVDCKTYGATKTQIVYQIKYDGKYIDQNGNVFPANGFKYTEPFYIGENTLITIKTRGYLNNVAILSKVVIEDSNYTPVIISSGSSLNTYTAFISDSGNYALSFYGTQAEVFIYDNTPAKILNLIEDLNFTNVIDTIPSETIISGKYIDNNGIEQTSGAFSRSEPIPLNPGQTILLNGHGYLTNVSMISMYLNNTFSPLVISLDSELHLYMYTNTSQTTVSIVISFNKNEFAYKITNNVTSIFSNFINEKTNSVFNEVNGTGDYQRNVEVEIEHKFINASGTLENSYPFNATKPIFVLANSIIKIKAAGYNTAVSMISEYDYNNRIYKSLVMSISSSKTEYSYTTTHDGFFVFSYNSSNGIDVTVTSTASLLDRFGEVKTNVDNILTNTIQNVLCSFDNIVAIGDSLTYSVVYTSSSDYRQSYVPYPKVLERLCGNDATIIASPGADATYMWEHYQNDIIAKEVAIGLLFLGTNNGLTNTVDTDASGTDTSTWANNNTGNYCRIVNKMLDVGYKVVLIKPYIAPNYVDTLLTIDAIAEKFNVAVIEAPVLPRRYHLWPNGGGSNIVHLNDFGYNVFAQEIIRKIFALSDNMIKRIFPM